MRFPKTFFTLFSIVGMLLTIGIHPQPLLAAGETAPQVIISSPQNDERIVFPYGGASGTRTLAFMFDQSITSRGDIADVIEVTNTSTNALIPPSKLEIYGNMLYFTSRDFTYSSTGVSYEATIHADQIFTTASATGMASDYTINFSLVNPGNTSPENAPSIRIEQGILTPQVTIDQTDVTAIYKLSVYNTGEYDLSTITLKVAFPKGFSFDRILSGNFTATAMNTEGNLVEFRSGSLLKNNGTDATFRVNVLTGASHTSGRVGAGVYNSSTIGYGTFVPSGLGAQSFTTPIITNYEDNREDDEDLVLTRVRPSDPQSTNNTGTQTGATLLKPTIDPLPCLIVNGAPSLTLSDVSNLVTEKRFIDFLTSTVYVENTAVRLGKGYTDGSYGTNNTLTRFEVTKMALGANCIDYTNAPTPNRIFNDVPQDNSELALVIGKAQSLGIVNGIGDRFFPNQPVSYGEMVKILVGAGVYFNRGAPVTAQPSSLDGITDETFRQFAEHAQAMDLINIENNTFPQNAPVIRRFMAQAVARYVVWLKNLQVL